MEDKICQNSGKGALNAHKLQHERSSCCMQCTVISLFNCSACSNPFKVHQSPPVPDQPSERTTRERDLHLEPGSQKIQEAHLKRLRSEWMKGWKMGLARWSGEGMGHLGNDLEMEIPLFPLPSSSHSQHTPPIPKYLFFDLANGGNIQKMGSFLKPEFL